MADKNKMKIPEKQKYDKVDNKLGSDSDKPRENDQTNCYGAYEADPNTTNSIRPDYQYKNAREYAQVLQTWLWQYRFFAAMNAFHTNLILSMPSGLPQNQTFSSQQPNNQQYGQRSASRPPGRGQEPARNTDVTGNLHTDIMNHSDQISLSSRLLWVILPYPAVGQFCRVDH